MAGQDPQGFGRVTFRELQIVLDGAARRDERLAWLAGRYNAFAFHQPNEMPDPTEAVRRTRVDPEVEREMKALRNAARLRADMERAKRHGR